MTLSAFLSEQQSSLQAALEQAQADAKGGRPVNPAAMQKITEGYEAKIQVLTEALLFYADETHYKIQDVALIEGVQYVSPSVIDMDAGDNARKALAKL